MNHYEQILTPEFLSENRLGLDDTFEFRCRACGKCCKNNTDITLSAHDIFRIAQYLGRSTQEIIEGYCEIIPGKDSEVPIVYAAPQGPEAVCPFLLDRKCKVHAVKPTVCALFPLGRFYRDNEETIFLQPDQTSCGRKDGERTTTVRKWIGDHATEEFQFIGRLWGDIIFQLTCKLLEFRSTPLMKYPRTKYMIFNAMAQDLYLGYDTNAPFVPQLQYRQVRLNRLCKSLGELLQLYEMTGDEQS